MKKVRSYCLSLLLAAAVILCACPLSAVAEENLTAMPAELEIIRSGEGDSFEAVVESIDELGGVKLLEDNAKVFNAPNADYAGADMYSQLTSRQKACYDALAGITLDDLLTMGQVEYSGKTYYRATLPITGMTGTSMSGAITGGTFVPSGSSVGIESQIYTDLCAAIVALRYDRPQTIWLGYMRYGYKMEKTGENNARITNIMFDFHLTHGGEEVTMQQEIEAAASEMVSRSSSAADTYSRVKELHDIIVLANTYGDTNDEKAHTAYSALVSGTPVCDGYAKGFKILCDLEDIPCVLVSSATHMWNAVRMDDGEWYYIDLTWDDDDSEEILYDYFLVGSETIVGGVAFSKQKDHIELNPYEPYYAENSSGVLKPVVLSFPVACKTAYVYIGSDYKPLSFPDVKRTAWYYEPVENAAALGLFAGDPSGNFLPEKSITRAEFTKVMAAALGADLTLYSNSSFTDVFAGDWYASAAAWAQTTGLMSGYEDGSFRPNASITRQEMCMVLYNAMSVKATPTGYTFKDDADIADWAREAVYSCQAAGLVNGDDHENFTPVSNTMRCHAAVVFVRFASLLNA